MLTAEQRAIFDETVRLRQLDALNGGEAGLDARDAKHHGHLNKHHASLLPGNRVKKGENNRIQVDLSDAAHPIYVLDHGDPNYDSGEEPYKLKAGRLRAPRGRMSSSPQIRRRDDGARVLRRATSTRRRGPWTRWSNPSTSTTSSSAS